MTQILPVIHLYPDSDISISQSIKQSKIIFDAGLDGLFFISHHGKEQDVLDNALLIKKLYPNKKIGVNFLTLQVDDIIKLLGRNKIDYIWFDNAGVSSKGIVPYAVKIKEEILSKGIEVFAGVAFKYQALEDNPKLAVEMCHFMKFIPTTSGSQTGSAPVVDKISNMRNYFNPNLAIASGMTPENVDKFVGFVTHILVSTGISKNEYEIDESKLKKFISAVKSADTLYSN